MPDRVPSDHQSVTTVGSHVERSGGTRRPVLRLPPELDLPEGDLIRIILDRDEYHARVGTDADGRLLYGAYDARSQARDPADATNRLVEWFDDRDLEAGSAVEIDEVVAGDRYGLRAPGERAVYEVAEPPNQSLRDIAESLDG